MPVDPNKDKPDPFKAKPPSPLLNPNPPGAGPAVSETASLSDMNDDDLDRVTDPNASGDLPADDAGDPEEQPVKNVVTAVQPLGTVESGIEQIVDSLSDEFKAIADKGKEAIERLADRFKADKSKILSAAVASTHLGGTGSLRGGALRGQTFPVGAQEIKPDNERSAEIVDKTGAAPHVANSLTAPGANL